MSSDIHIRKEGRAGRITLTRPQALNAVSHEMCLAIEAALDAWRDDAQVALVLIDATATRRSARAATSSSFTRPGAPGITARRGGSGPMNTG